RDHPRPGELAADRLRGFHAAHPGHAHVEQRDVRQVQAEHLHCLVSVGGFGDHCHILLQVDNRGDPHPRHQVVLGNQNSYFVAHGNGTVTSTSVPSPGLLANLNSPPSRSARSRIPITPKCPVWEANTSCRSNPRPLSLIRRWIWRSSRCSFTPIRLAPACFRALVTASWAIRNRCCSISSGNFAPGPMTSTASSTPDPAVHNRVPDSIAAARSCPSSADARRL